MLGIILIVTGLWLIFGGLGYSHKKKLKPWAGSLFAFIGLICFFIGSIFFITPNFF